MKKFLILLTIGGFGIINVAQAVEPFDKVCNWYNAEEITAKDYEQIVKAFKEKYSMHYNGSGIVVDKKVEDGKYYLLVSVVRPCSELEKKEIICKFLPNCIKLQITEDIYNFVEYPEPKLSKVSENKWISLGHTEIEVKENPNAKYLNCKDMKYIIDGQVIETNKLQICNY